MLVAGVTAAHAQGVAGPNRPEVVPTGYVITPFGYFHPSCVAHLAKGDGLLEGAIRHADGTTSAKQGCAYPHYRADGEMVYGDERAVKGPDISHAWIEDASVTTTASYGGLYAEWSVPPTPTSNDGQILFYFPGLEDSNDVLTIVQTVLGWNSDYTSAWGIASWNCCENGTTYEGPPQRVSPGDTIRGLMFDTCTAGTLSCSTWNIVTCDLQNGACSELVNSSSLNQTFNWAFGGAVEVYNVIQCTDYPSNGAIPYGNGISFNEVVLFNDSFVPMANPGWQVSNLSSGLTPQCSYGGTIPNQVILTY